ncbi:MAG TPA: branched-chain amino acid ABC transporter permease [Xanthobacteraceae bacterium]|nr:branched-chain amino acid ABC transporter permease [Xanthobacteraceae bacterium]
MSAYLAAVLTQVGIYALMTTALNLQYGFTGLINFGLVAFYCIGAYAVAILGTLGYGPLFAVSVALLVAAAAAWPLGLLTLRLRGDFLAIVTLGLSEVIRLVAINERSLTKGAGGIAGIPQPLAAWSPWGLLATLLFANVVAVLIFRRLVRSPFGRVIRAIRDDEDALRTLGKSPLGFRTRILVIGCMLMSLAGAFQASNIGFVSPDQFSPEVTFLVWIALILGGSGSLWGALVGALALFGFLEGSRYIRDLIPGIAESDLASLRLAAVGLGFIVLTLFRPQGIVGLKN